MNKNYLVILMLNFSLIILTAVLIQHGVSGLKCYNCYDADCGDPYPKPASHLIECQPGVTLCSKAKVYSTGIVARLCDFDAGCVNASLDTGYLFCCGTDGCNGFS